MKFEFLNLRPLTTRTIGFIILIASFVLFSAGINRSSIYILDESKNAQCAWEMMSSPNHIIPTFNGQLRTDKPALHYYIMMAGYVIFGKSSIGARFFSSVSGALLMWILFLFVNRYATRGQFFCFLLYFFGFDFFFQSGKSLIYHRDFQEFKSFFKGVYDGMSSLV